MAVRLMNKINQVVSLNGKATTLDVRNVWMRGTTIIGSVVHEGTKHKVERINGDVWKEVA